jgi:NhaA family Na+:H+ antiporter
MSVLAGIGFTFSIFISMIAFADPSFHQAAKLSVLLASVLSIITGLSVIFLSSRRAPL